MIRTNQIYWTRESGFEKNDALTDRFFAVPRRCGRWIVRAPEIYHSHGMPRPFPDQKRILFQYTIAGNAELLQGKKSRKMSAGDAMILLLPADVEYLKPPQAELWEFLYVSFWHPFAVKMIQNVLAADNNVMRFDPEGPVIKCLWELFRQFQEITSFDRYAAADAGYRFLLHLCRQLTAEKHAESKGALLPRVQAYCNTHLAQPVTSEELASYCGYSRGYFSNLFHRETGMSPLEFILKTKLDAAIRIYQTERIPIKELAARCGFQDQGYFTRRFRASYHMTPCEYFRLF